MKKFKLVGTRKVDFKECDQVKPVAIIYNPNSGRKVNLIPLIENRLT